MAIAILITFLIGSFAGMVLIETIPNDGWEFAFKLVGIVEAIFVPIALYGCRKRLRDFFWGWPFRAIIIVFVGACGMGILFGAPYVLLVNAASSPGEAVRFEGPVLSKHEHHGRSTTLVVVVLDRYSGKRVSLPTRREEYESVKVGATMSRCIQIGGLGIPFRWRYFRTPVCEAT